MEICMNVSSRIHGLRFVGVIAVTLVACGCSSPRGGAATAGAGSNAEPVATSNAHPGPAGTPISPSPASAADRVAREDAAQNEGTAKNEGSAAAAPSGATPAPAATVSVSDPATPSADVPAPPAAGADSRREMFPGVFVDLKNRTVDWDGIVPINVNDPATPVVYLELVACIPDTKEHETLVMSSVKPSNVHAALLLIGLQPGKPGGWKYENEQLIAVNPTGDEVDVRVSYTAADGSQRNVKPQEMVTNLDGTRHLGDAKPGSWVFAGSRLVKRQGREWYDADGAGMLIGLATFGAETIAWSHTFSAESVLNEPEWIADRAVVPPAGTAVRITVRPASK